MEQIIIYFLYIQLIGLIMGIHFCYFIKVTKRGLKFSNIRHFVTIFAALGVVYLITTIDRESFPEYIIPVSIVFAFVTAGISVVICNKLGANENNKN